MACEPNWAANIGPSIAKSLVYIFRGLFVLHPEPRISFISHIHWSVTLYGKRGPKTAGGNSISVD